MANYKIIERAVAVQKKAAALGFDWPDARAILDKLREETDELEEAILKNESRERLKEEYGDLLFVLCHFQNHLDIKAVDALEGAVNKFEKRFQALDDHLETQGLKLNALSPKEQEAAWQQVKAMLKKTG